MLAWGICSLPFPCGLRRRDWVIFLSLLRAFPSSFSLRFCFAGCISFLPMFLPSFSSSVPTLGHCASPDLLNLFSQSRDHHLFPVPGPQALHATRVGVCVHVALSFLPFTSQCVISSLPRARLQDDRAAAERGGTQ